MREIVENPVKLTAKQLEAADKAIKEAKDSNVSVSMFQLAGVVFTYPWGKFIANECKEFFLEYHHREGGDITYGGFDDFLGCLANDDYSIYFVPQGWIEKIIDDLYLSTQKNLDNLVKQSYTGSRR